MVLRTKELSETEPKLLAEERRRKILELVDSNGRVTVDELVRRFGVSAVTARADLDGLSELGTLKRTRGGAVRSLEPALRDYPLTVKEAIYQEEKARIGRAAAELVQPGQTVILDSGSTTAEVARYLKRSRLRNVTVITNALNIASDLADAPGFTVITIGGIVRHISHSCVGPQAEQMLRELHADHLFLGVDGLDPELGPSTPDVLEAQLNALMVRTSREVTIVADASKFGRRSLSIIAPMKSVGRVITDAGIAPGFVEALRKVPVEVLIV